MARYAFTPLNPADSVVDVYVTANGGVPLPYPSPTVTLGVLLLLEGIGTFMWVMAFFGTVLDPKAPPIGGFAIGLTVTLDILVIGPITGASMNPARSFGPALATFHTSAFERVWTYHGAYWIGPIAGGLIAGLIYKWFFLARPAEG